MQLCIDIGNSFIKLAVFDEQDKMIYHKYFEHVLVRDLKFIQKKTGFKRVIISSVRSKKLRFFNFLNNNFKCIWLDHKTKLPFNNSYKTPKTLGKDRVAAVAAGCCLYPSKNVLIVDIGTCATIDFIDKTKNYLGGNISPGVKMRLRAMHEFTSSLPMATFKAPTDLLGMTTKQALNNGAVFGVCLEIESYIRRLKTQYGNINVILTGGDATFFGELIDYKIFVDPNLVLKGLNEILKLNT